jgi:hypothetical protein
MSTKIAETLGRIIGVGLVSSLLWWVMKTFNIPFEFVAIVLLLLATASR